MDETLETLQSNIISEISLTNSPGQPFSGQSDKMGVGARNHLLRNRVWPGALAVDAFESWGKQVLSYL